MSRVGLQRLSLLPSAAARNNVPLGQSWTSFQNQRVRPTASKKVLPNRLLRAHCRQLSTSSTQQFEGEDEGTYSEANNEHAVISTFDLFSVGIGPSSSHTVGPMRAGKIFVADLVEADVLPRVSRIRIGIYGSLALTGEGHMTPSSILLGLEGANVETVDTAHVPKRFAEIKSTKKIFLGQGLAPDLATPGKEIDFDYTRDFIWEWGRKLPLHSNGMRFTVFDKHGDVLATNDMFSVGGGFVVNGALSVNAAAPESEDVGSRHPIDLGENMYYKKIRRSKIKGDRRTGPEIKHVESVDAVPAALIAATGPDVAAGGLATTQQSPKGVEVASKESSSPQPKYEYAFRDAASLLAMCRKHNLTIAQLVYENEKSHGYSDELIYAKLSRIWQVMDASILEAVQAPQDSVLPGSLKLKRRAPALYQRLTRGMYHSVGKDHVVSSSPAAPPSTEKAALGLTDSSKALIQAGNQINGVGLRRRSPARTHGSFEHPILPSPTRRTTFQTMDYLTVYAIAVNETNAAGGRIVTAPTNGAAGIIPAVLKYIIEFISDDPDRDIPQFLLTAAAIGMLYKRGATISAAEGGCMAEVGVACSMAAGAFAACMGASPETIEQAAEIGIEHNLGLTCDPIGGLVQAPCIERNALGAIKAISSANLALSSDPGTQKVRLDDAIHAMRLTAKGMRNEFKETSLSGLATSVALNIPVSVPSC